MLEFLVIFNIRLLMCGVQFICSSRSIPKNLVSGVLVITWLPISSCIFSDFPVFWNRMHTVFPIFSVNLLHLNQSTNFLRSSSKHHVKYFKFLCDLYSVVSSANNMVELCSICLYKSLVKIIKISVTGLYSEYSILPLLSIRHFTPIFLFVR